MSTKGGPVFAFSLPGGQLPPCPPSVMPLIMKLTVFENSLYLLLRNVLILDLFPYFILFFNVRKRLETHFPGQKFRTTK